MARVKKLLSLPLLEEGNELLDLGVPMTKVHNILGLHGEWSYQSTTDIFKADRHGHQSATRPPWLKDVSTRDSILVEPPLGWSYSGVFPFGMWVTAGGTLANES